MVPKNHLRFRDPAVEQRFQMDYAAPRPVIEHAVAAVALITLASSIVRPYLVSVFCYLPLTDGASCAPAAADPLEQDTAAQLLFSTAVTLVPTVLTLLLPKQNSYSVARHLLHAVGRVLFTVTLLSSDRISNTAVWQHRTLLLHLLAALSRCPIELYTCGALATWAAAVAVDLADPPGDSGPPVSGLLTSLLNLPATLAAATSEGFLQASRVAAVVVSSSSLLHLGDAIAPALLVLLLERKARRSWLAGQQQDQQPKLSDSSAGDSSSTDISSSSSKSDVDDQAGLQEQLLTAPGAVPATAEGPSSGSSSSKIQYSGPLHRRAFSFKFSHPPNAGPEDYQRLMRTVVAALQSHLDAASTGTAPSTATAASNPAAAASAGGSSSNAAVTQCIGFQSCYQLVLDVVSTRAAATAWQQQQQQVPINDIMQAVQHDMPGWRFAAWQELQATPAAAAASLEVAAAATYISPAALSCSAAMAIGSSSSSSDDISNGASSSGSSSDTDSSATATPGSSSSSLLVPALLIELLSAAGHESLRVFVARQVAAVPAAVVDGEVVLDRTCALADLEPAWDTSVAAATAAAAGTAWFCIDLEVLDADPAAQQQLTQTLVGSEASGCLAYTVVVLKGPVVTNTTAAAAVAAAAGGAAAAMPEAHAGTMAGATAATAATDSTSPAAAAAGASNILMQLPLLLLPAAAQQELESVLTAAMQQGRRPHEAYQLLLPLLQDWALLLLLPPVGQAGSSGAGSSGVGLTSVVLLQMKLACDALLQFFGRLGKLTCYELLLQQRRLLLEHQALAAAAAAAENLTAAATVQATGTNGDSAPVTAATTDTGSGSSSSSGSNGGSSNGGDVSSAVIDAAATAEIRVRGLIAVTPPCVAVVLAALFLGLAVLAPFVWGAGKFAL